MVQERISEEGRNFCEIATAREANAAKLPSHKLPIMAENCQTWQN